MQYFYIYNLEVIQPKWQVEWPLMHLLYIIWKQELMQTKTSWMKSMNNASWFTAAVLSQFFMIQHNIDTKVQTQTRPRKYIYIYKVQHMVHPYIEDKSSYSNCYFPDFTKLKFHSELFLSTKLPTVRNKRQQFQSNIKLPEKQGLTQQY